MSERDLAWHRDEAHEPECPAGVRRAEADLDEILRLMDLHRVPGEEPEEITDGDPPEAARPNGPGERPVDCRPPGVHDVRASGSGRAARGGVAIGQEADILGPSSQHEIQRDQHAQHQKAERPAGGAPAGSRDERLQPRQEDDRADADAGEGDAHRQTAPAHEPVRQIERLPRVP